MKTVFIRTLEVGVEEKLEALRAGVKAGSPLRYEVDARAFEEIPRTPFAYWVSERIRNTFSGNPSFSEICPAAVNGTGTLNDFRFVRLWFECPPAGASSRPPFAKGGATQAYYAGIPTTINWQDDGAELKAYVVQVYGGGSWSRSIRNTQYYGKAGITWPLRASRFSPAPLPKGCIFSVRSYAAFPSADWLAAAVALCSSAAFDALFKILLGRFGHPEFVCGSLLNVPIPKVPDSSRARLAALFESAWRLRRAQDSRTETSHPFTLPALLQVKDEKLVERAEGWAKRTAVHLKELEAISSEIDVHAYELYGISDQDRLRIEQGFGGSTEDDSAPADDEDGDESDEDGNAEVDATPMVASLLSWTLGAAFGRFDIRLATGDREAPPEPEPFDPLPVCSPGMLTGDDGLPVAAPPASYPLTFPTDGILVDDPGHPRDVVRAVRSVFETVFDDANARWHEAAELLGTPDLRTWFARDFFEPHIKRYSKSRRKAPIYWQLATASGSYSVWIYIHRATGDTLFRVLNDFVGPKLDHEKAKLDGLTQEGGGNPSAAQRREIEQQETFVGELQALKTEVARVAPLWKPNLDDGVILNCAPLWRLVPQSRSWQGECKKAWDKLVAGDYDWAHLAMHLWPERVVPKCIDDRSLAIAHGLEDVFWHEDDSAAWRKRRVDDATVQMLIHERISTTVKAALRDLLSAPQQSEASGKKRRR